MATEAKQQKVDDTSKPQTLSLVWLDSLPGNSEESIAGQEQLRTFDTNIKHYNDDNQCEQYIKSIPNVGQIILVVNGGLGEKLVPRVHELPQILSIYVYCIDKVRHQQWADKYPTKVKRVVTQLNDLKNVIKMNHFNNNSSKDNQENTGTYEVDVSYMISDSCINYLSQIKETEKDKDEFVAVWKAAVEESPIKMPTIQKFQQNYTSDQILSWFRDEQIFGKVLDKAFQSTDIEKLYCCRFCIRDIQKIFEQQKYTTTVRVYHTRPIVGENLQQLKNSKGKIITFKSFLSTNIKRDIAMAFIREQHIKNGVLFEIEADPNIVGAKPFIKMDGLPGQIDEAEVIFMLGSLFKIIEINAGEGGITIIKMALCANEKENPFKDQSNDTEQENDLIGYAQLQCNMSKYFAQPKILDNVDKLIEEYLKKLPENHADCIRCFDTLANVSFAQNNLDSSLSWYQKSLEMEKKQSQPNGRRLIDTYNNIGFVYLHKNNDDEALNAFKQMLIHSKQAYGDDHLCLISCYTNIIRIYESGGKFTEVLSCYFQICSIMLKLFPVDNENFATIYNNIGKTFVSLSQHQLALGYYETSLKIKLEKFPADSESTALTYKSIGIVHKALGRADQAKINFDKASEIYSKIYSSTHETVSEIQKLIQNLSTTSK